MGIFRHVAPLRAIRDLRGFLASRQRHELGFLTLSVMLTVGLIAGFVHDSSFPAEYRREILYVQSWPLDRSDAEIIAQQKVDLLAKREREAAARKRQLEVQAQFKRLDDKLEAWNL